MPRTRPNGDFPRLFPILCLLAVALGTLVAAPLSKAARGAEAADAEALQIIADAVLIDARCREIPVDFGAVMHYGTDHGFPAADLLPLGAMRARFEAALARRAGGPEFDTLCTAGVDRVRALGLLKPS